MLALNAAGSAASSGGGGGAEKSRGLRGMIGKALEQKREPKEQPKNEQQQTQGTLAKVFMEIRDVRSTSVPASMFELPAGYREVPLNQPR